jgi:hypothetical protein
MSVHRYVFYGEFRHNLHRRNMICRTQKHVLKPGYGFSNPYQYTLGRFINPNGQILSRD